MTTFFCYIRSVLLFFNKNMDIKTNKEQKGKKKRYKGVNSHISYVIPIVRHYMLLEHPSLLLWQSIQ